MNPIKTLNEVLQTCWQLLQKGATQKDHPFHTPVVGTVDKQGVRLRTIVLRKTAIQKRQLYFYTDIRSAKVEQLKSNSTLSWLFYDAQNNRQIRATGKAVIHYQNNLALQSWQSIPFYGRKTYGSIHPPSTPLAQPGDDLPPFWKSENHSLQQTDYTYANFAVVRCEIYCLEWLNLQRAGHQRASFEFVNNQWQGQWITP